MLPDLRAYFTAPGDVLGPGDENFWPQPCPALQLGQGFAEGCLDVLLEGLGLSEGYFGAFAEGLGEGEYLRVEGLGEGEENFGVLEPDAADGLGLGQGLLLAEEEAAPLHGKEAPRLSSPR